MYAPILEIDTRKIEENARKLHTFCARRGVELAFVTKGFSARPGVIRAARARRRHPLRGQPPEKHHRRQDRHTRPALPAHPHTRH